MKKSIKYSIFIPCYNEEEKIIDTIKLVTYVMDYFYGKKCYEIILVDDASTDNTLRNIVDYSKIDKRIIYISYRDGPTRRENLSLSFKHAKGDIILFLDADLSTFIFHINKILDEVSDEQPIVIGNRYHKDSVILRKPFRLFASKIMNWLTRTLFNTKLQDHFIGWKAFKKDVLLSLVDEMGYQGYNNKRSMWWDAELLVRALSRKIYIGEVPVLWLENKKSSLRLFTDIKILVYMFKFWWKWNSK